MAAAGIAAACNYGNLAGEDSLLVRRVSLPIENLPAALDGLRIVHMSDFHLHPFTQIEQVEQAVALLISFNPTLLH